MKCSAFLPVCPMGGGATRLYSTLTQSLGGGSSPPALPPSYLDPEQSEFTNLDPDFYQVGLLKLSKMFLKFVSLKKAHRLVSLAAAEGLHRVSP